MFRCDDNYDKECKGEKTMPFYRAQYDTSTGQAPNTPREQVILGFYSKIFQLNFQFYQSTLRLIFLCCIKMLLCVKSED